MITNVWLSALCILGLVFATISNAIHAWDGNSYRYVGYAIFNVLCIYLFSLNIRRWWKNK